MYNINIIGGKHVEGNMLNAGMHEHVGYKLVDLKVGSHKEMESEHVVQIYTHTTLDHVHHDECQGVDD